jgi:4-hydroxybenzoate polyprenyltransferase
MMTVAAPARRPTSSKGQALAQLTRPANARLPLMVFLASRWRTAPSLLVAGAVLILLSYGVAMILNDLVDVDADNLNGRRGPLVSGSLSRHDAYALLAVLVVALAALQPTLRQPGGFIVTFLVGCSSVAYSCAPLSLQSRGIIGTAQLAATYVGAPIALAFTQTQRSAPLPATITIGGVLLAAMATILYKDFRDEHGDRSVGKRTPVVRYGRPAVHCLAVVLHGIAVAFVALGRGFDWWVVPAVVAFGCYVWLAVRQQSSGHASTAHRILLPAFIILALSGS